jgi:hypothetical protein
MRVRESAQFLLLERSWHRSQGKGGPNECPERTSPPPFCEKLPRLVTMLSRTVTRPTCVISNLKSYHNQQAHSRLNSYQSGRRDLNPRPHKPTLLANSGLFDRKSLSPLCPESSSLQELGTTGFVEDWWRTERLRPTTLHHRQSA